MQVIDKLIYKLGYATDAASLGTAKSGLASLASAAATVNAAVVAAGAALGALAAEAASYGDSISKTASKLGIGTDELQEYQHAAKLAGIEVRTFNMATQRMVRRISEAAKGQGEAKGALEELGLSATKLNKMSPDQQLLVIADSMATVGNQADRVRLSMRLFDSEGVAMVNMLGEGSEAILAMREEFRALGGVMSGDDIQNAVKFTDLMTEMWVVIKGLSRLLGAKLFVPLNKVMNLFKEWYKINRDIISQNLESMVDGLIWALTKMAQAVQFVAQVFSVIIDFFKWLGFAVVPIIIGIAGALGLWPPILKAVLLLSRGIMLSFFPWLIVIAAVALLLQDIYVWMEGGDSLIGAWLGPFDEFKASVQAFLDKLPIWWDQSVKSVLDSLDDISDWWDNLKQSVIDGIMLITNLAGALGKLIASAFTFDLKGVSAAASKIASLFGLGEDTASGAQPAPLTATGSSFVPNPDAVPNQAAPATNMQQTNTFNITGVNNDEAVAEAVARKVFSAEAEGMIASSAGGGT